MDEVGAAISKAIGKHIEVQYLTREQLLANGVRSSVIDAQEWGCGQRLHGGRGGLHQLWSEAFHFWRSGLSVIRMILILIKTLISLSIKYFLHDLLDFLYADTPVSVIKR